MIKLFFTRQFILFSIVFTFSIVTQHATGSLEDRSKVTDSVIEKMETARRQDTSSRNFLPESWRIFAKHMLYASHETSEIKATAYDQAIESLRLYFNSEAETVKINSLEEYIEARYSGVDRYTFLEFEIQHLRQGRGAQRKEYVFADDAVRDAVHSYHQDQELYVRQNYAELLQNGGGETLSSADRQKFEYYAYHLLSEMINIEDPTVRGKSAKELFSAVSNLEVSREQQIKMVNTFEVAFDRIEREIRGVGDKVAEDSSRFEVKSGALRGAGRMIQLLLGGIFRYESKEGIKNMISGMIDFPDQRSNVERFKLILKYSFPQSQKILQIVAKIEGFGAKMADIFGSLESDGKAAPGELIKDLIDSERPRMEARGVKLISWDTVALKAGTIAQIHSAVIEMEEDGVWVRKEVVLRLVKPGMVEAINRGEIVMTKAAVDVDIDPELNELHWPRLGPEVPGLTINIRADIDVEGSFERQGMGEEYYAHTFETKIVSESKDYKLFGYKIWSRPIKFKTLVVHYTVPKVYYHSKGDSEAGLMIMDKVSGEKLERVSEMVPEVAQGIARGMILKWLDVAFILKGFFHADLHQGNFMSRVMTPADLLIEGDRAKVLYDNADRIEVEVPILDYGMGGVLPMARRTHFIGIAMAAKLKDADFMKDMFWKLRVPEQTTISEADLLQMIASKMDEQREIEKLIKNIGIDEVAEQGKKLMAIQDWVVVAANAGVRLPLNFVGLSRGTGAMMVLSTEYGFSKGFGGMMKELLLHKPSTVPRVLVNGLVPKWQLSKSVGRTVVRKCVNSVSNKFRR